MAETSMDSRQVGRVKWFDDAKGYGFIEGRDGADVFVHYTQIQGEGWRLLREEQEVSYTCIQTDKGLQAQDVTLFA